MCCGQKRTELQISQSRKAGQNPPAVAAGINGAQVVRSQPTMSPGRKAAITERPASPPAEIQPIGIPATSPTARSAIGIRYLEHSPIRVRGVVSGAYYEFSRAHPVLQIDARDSAPLLNSRFFRRQ